MSELLPTNIEAEEAILGGILIDKYALDRVVDRLKPEHFAIDAHQLIYRAILEVNKSGHPIDLMTVTICLADSDWLEEIGGQSKMFQLAERTVSAVNIDAYTELLIDKYIRRRLIFAGNEVVQLGYNTSLAIEDVEDKIASSLATIKLERNYAKATGKLTTSLFDWALQSPPKPTQWLVQDLFRCKDIVLVCGATGSGKSTVISSIFRCIAKGEDCLGKKVRKGKVLWHTSDEPEGDLFVRITGKWKVDENNPECWSKNFIKLDSGWNYHQFNKLEEILEDDKNQSEGDRIKAICIDSLSSAIVYPLGLDINSAEMGTYINAFKPLTEKYGVAVFIIHHENKDRDAKGVSKANGSRTIVNHSDMMIQIAGEPRTGVVIKASKVRGVLSPWEIKAQLENEPHVLGVEGSLSCHLVVQSYERKEEAKAESDDINLKELAPRDAIAIFLEAYKGKWYRRGELQEAIGHEGSAMDDKYKIVLAKMIGDGEIALNPNPARTNWPEYGHVDNRVQTVTPESTAGPSAGPAIGAGYCKSAQDMDLEATAGPLPPPSTGGGPAVDDAASLSVPVVVNKAIAISVPVIAREVRSNEFKVGDRVRIARGSDTDFDWHTGTIKKLLLLASPQEANIELEKKVKGRTRKLTVHLSKLELLNHD